MCSIVGGAVPVSDGKESVDANSRLMALVALGLMLAIVGALLAAVLRPNMPLQLTGIALILIGVAAMGYVIGFQRQDRA